MKTLVVLSFAVPGMPLVYNGQEAGLNKRLDFFEKDQIDWNGDPSMTEFYSRLIDLKQNNKALWNGLAGGEINFLETSSPEKLLTFKREKDGNSVIVIMNLSAVNLEATVQSLSENEYTDYFTGNKIKVGNNLNISLKPWDYWVFENK